MRTTADGAGSGAAPGAVTGPALGLVAGWFALWTWSGLVVQPRGYLLPTLVGGALLVVLGVGLRALRLHAAAVATAQLLLVAVVVQVVAAGAPGSAVGLAPRPASLAALLDALERGAVALATRIAPVSEDLSDVHLLLVGCGLLLVWGVDVVAWSVRRPPLAALPVLVGVSIPATVLVDGIDTWVFVVIAVAYVLLLASDRGGRHRGAADATSYDAAPGGPAGHRRTAVVAGLGAAQVAAVAVLSALVVAPLVPVGDPFGVGGTGGGGGTGDGELSVTTQNPVVSLRRDLLQQTDTPMVYARTDAVDPSYLRTAVLDSFTDESWSASTRLLSADNLASGVFPAPEGIASGTGGVESRWQLRLAPGFRTRWLPVPVPLRELEVSGEWRYDQRFLDVALPSGRAEDGLRYSATAFTPAITGRALDRAISAPAALQRRMTVVPDDLPPVIAQRAREVTAGAKTPYQQAVALQDWFRDRGGFRYSLEAGPGQGLDLLARFVTDDRVGYCEQFAAAMAAMGRTLGIPSRVAVGFLSPEQVGDDTLLYTSDARHAWPEMFFTGVGWVRFEPTPSARTGASPDYTRDSVEAPTPTATPSQGPPPREQSPAEQQAEQDQGSGSSLPQLVGWLVALVLLAGALVAPRVVRRRQRASRLGAAGAEDQWRELRATVLDAGLPWDDHRSPREQAHALVVALARHGADQDDPEVMGALERVLARVEHGRYARPAATGSVATLERQQPAPATEDLQRWLALAERGGREERRALGWPHRVVRSWWPTSLLRR